MSKGSQVVFVRVPADQMALIEAAIESRNEVSPQEPMNLSSWIRQAINEKLRHLIRGRSKAKKLPVKEKSAFTCHACLEQFPIAQGRNVSSVHGTDIDMCEKCFDNWYFTGHNVDGTPS